MYRMLLSFLFLAAPFTAFAQNCYLPTLESFAAYAIGDMDVRFSDHEGLSGAGGNLNAENFLFEGRAENCLALSVGGSLFFRDGTAGNSIEAQQVSLTRVNVAKGTSGSLLAGTYHNAKARRVQLSRLSVNHAQLAADLIYSSKVLNSWNDTLTPVRDGSLYTVVLNNGTGVVSFQASDFQVGTTLIIKGRPENHLVINIRGDRVILDGLNVRLEGGILPSSIRWNFVDATFLYIVRTHDPVLGIPGVLLAPCADAEFYEGLITGSLWVRNLYYHPARGLKHSGQINKYNRQAPAPRPCNCK